MASVFISYSRKDMGPATRLESALSTEGFTTFRDVVNMRAGSQWPATIGKAILEADALILLWSANASSHWCTFEWSTALALRKPVIPLLLTEAPLPPSLSGIMAIPYSPIDAMLDSLLPVLRGGGTPDSAPGPDKEQKEVL